MGGTDNIHLVEKIAILSMIIIGSFLMNPGISSWPSGKHSWTQSDHFAITLKFAKGEGSLFKPQSFELDPPYGGPDILHEYTGITKADFPLMHWISGKIMQVTGSKSPVTQRVIWLFSGILGWFFLFLIIRSKGANAIIALTVSTLALASPVWLYFQSAFIPSIPALSFLITGVYFWHIRKSWILGGVLLSLCMLMRPTLLLVVGPLLLGSLYKSKGSKDLWPQLRVLIIAGFLVVAYELYNQSVQAQYGSLFLVSPEWPDSMGEAFGNMLKAAELQLFTWGAPGQWICAAFVIAVLFYHRALGSYRFEVFTALGLVTLFTLMMSRQFVHHDYYVLDTWVPILLVSLSLCELPERLKPFIAFEMSGLRTPVVLILGYTLCVMQAGVNVSSQRNFRAENNADMFNWTFSEQQELLERSGISRDDTLLVMPAGSHNGPLMRMDRDGFTLVTTSSEHIEEAMSQPWSYAIVPHWAVSSDILQEYPIFRTNVVAVSHGGRNMIYARGDGSSQSDREFFGIDSSNVIMSILVGDAMVTPVEADSVLDLSVSGAFPFTIKIDSLELDENLPLRIMFQLGVHSEAPPDLRWVVTTDNGFYKEHKLKVGQGNTAELCHVLPEMYVESLSEIKIYLWNVGKSGMVEPGRTLLIQER